MSMSVSDDSASGRLRCDIEGATAYVTLLRAEVHNALDAAAIKALTAVFADMDDAVRIVVVAGAGKSFCAGADLGDMQASVAYTPARNRADAEALSALFATVAAAPQVVIARVHGAALGGGAGLVSCCDLVAAAPGARFGFTEARLGLAPAVIAPHVLRRVGAANAKRLFLTADIIDAQAAHKVGLVDSIADDVSPAALDAIIAAWQRAILRNGPKALARIKALLAQLAVLESEAGAALCIDTISEMRTSLEGQAGLQAFLHKQVPPWVLS